MDSFIYVIAINIISISGVLNSNYYYFISYFCLFAVIYYEALFTIIKTVDIIISLYVFICYIPRLISIIEF